MKVETKHGTFEIREITWAERRKLHARNAVLWYKSDNDLNLEKYYEFLEYVSEVSGVGEAEIGQLEFAEQDIVLQAIATEYLGLNQKKE